MYALRYTYIYPYIPNTVLFFLSLIYIIIIRIVFLIYTSIYPSIYKYINRDNIMFVYRGATVIVDKEYQHITLKKGLDRINMHLESKTCSDCVLVFHRIGDKLKNQIQKTKLDKNNLNVDLQSDIDSVGLSQSFNPFRGNASLWMEMDCGHFYADRLVNYHFY
jgi:hypothetical protein